jgi:hypothetical protein
VEWVVWKGWGQGGEMAQALYAHMNNKRKKPFNVRPQLLKLLRKKDIGNSLSGDFK